MTHITFTLNGKPVEADVADPDKPLLFLLRENFSLTGTKQGCLVGACGACTIHLNGESLRSCSYAAIDADGATITTIEGLSDDGSHPLQQAWIEGEVSQCGYCQSGQIMQAAAFLSENPAPTPAEIAEAMAENVCRCGTTPHILAAVERAAILARTENLS